MAVRPIVLYPDPVLLRPTSAVEVVDGKIRTLVEDMRDTLYAAPGIGLAANQIGVGLRVFIVNLTAGEQDSELHVFVNPEIRDEQGSEVGEEGCLSFPDVLLDVPRAPRVTVEALDLDGKSFEVTADGLMARVMLHEIEHLDGQTFLRNVSSLKRELVKRQIKKRIKAGEWVAFLGTPAVAVPFLDALIDADHEVDPVVSRPDRPVGRSGRPQAPPVKERALERGRSVLQPRGARGPAFAETLRAADLDVLVVVAYGRMLPRAVLDIARHGAVNVHFSLLPLYRGAAPVQWALARGEVVTGVCTMRLDEGMDTGDVLGCAKVEIVPGEHAPSLHRRLVDAGTGLLIETLELLRTGRARPMPQDHDAATYAPLLSREDGHVDPSDPARAIEGRIRGFDPWPGVWLSRAGRRFRLLDARELPGESTDAAPGTVLDFVDTDGARIACGGGTVLGVTRVQPDGRRAMNVHDAIRGRQFAPGDHLERIV